MLAYKSWREMRTVVLAGIAAMATACVFIVLEQQPMRDTADHPLTYIAYIWSAMYNSFGRDLYLILCIILGSGGLLQEKVHGTAGFTLTLPASRSRIVLTRGLIGYFGVLAIALTPVILLPLGSHYIGQFYPATQAAGFGLLWAACGSVFYGFTFLLAHLMEGEYSAMLVAMPSLIAYGFLMSAPGLDHLPMLNIFSVVNGEDLPFFDETQHLLIGPMPWITMAIMLLIATVFVFSAARRMESRDF